MFWLLSTAGINSFVVARQDQWERGNCEEECFDDCRTFLKDLAWQLVQEGYRDDHAHKTDF